MSHPVVSRFSPLLPSLCALWLLVMLFCSAGQAAEGIKNAISLCLGVLLPALFPFLVVTALLVELGAGETLTRFFTRGKGSSLWFSLFLSLTGGYPVAARTFSSLHAQGRLTREQAVGLVCCATGGGPAFVLTAVGAGMFRSSHLGVLLLAGQWGASLLLLLLYRLRSGPFPTLSPVFCGKKPGESLVTAVDSSCRAMVSICAWVLVFAGFSALLDRFFPALMAGPAGPLLSGLLEVTNGCSRAAGERGLFSPVLCGFFLGFGGSCIALQVQSLTQGIRLPLGRFLRWRLLQGSLGAGFTYMLLQIFPISLPVFLSTGSAVTKGLRAPAAGAVLLLLLCLSFLSFPRKEDAAVDKL